ncbi:MAG TPA: sialate O-acetylesterase [Gammaproteobacteria bacterium]|nr:sialate O-acetylesterase [Gammaproteobacteria bacterium]
MNKYIALPVLLLASVLTQPAHAQALRLPKIFADHMVLQRDSKVRFWGWAKPQQAVEVEINGTKARAATDAEGKWELIFPSSAAGGPYEIAVRAGESGAIRLKDVYFGDVWLASGQSNMEWKLGWKINNTEMEIKDSNYPLIRFFEVPNRISAKPLTDLDGGQWKPASPETAGEFSAIAWFFAKHNHKEKNVAVGIIDSTWGGTPAEAWVDAHRLLDFDLYKDQARLMLDPSVDWPATIAANEANEKLKQDLIWDKKRVLALKAHLPKYDDSQWRIVRLPNEQPFFNFVWLRKSFELDQLADRNRLRLGDLVQDAMIFVNGQLIAEENWLTDGSTHELPAGILKKGRNLIALRVANDWNNEVYAGKAGLMRLDVGGHEINLEGEWRYNNTLEPEMPTTFRYNWNPGFLYNGMIRPIEGYRMRGALWYQGESNTDQPQAYAELFKTLITDWRAKWNEGDFPFLFVQLASYGDKSPNADWPRLREAQTAALKLPNTGMAVTIDIGDRDDIHPRNKQDVGKRLWLNARKIAFKENVDNIGPMYKSHKISGDKILVRFDHVGQAFIAPNPELTGFTIAGADKQFHPAQARFKGDTVTVWSPDVPSPVAVRYAWENYIKTELYNWSWLPAAPFRTDNW